MSLAKLNELFLDQNGVWRSQNAAEFHYSDGEHVEQMLADVLQSASDLSSDSAEMEAQICNWPSEYHLSRARANLLRPLNLRGIKRVLELGCGCGSITRYLGEQPGVQVDAVDGSASRAALAASRCRDLQYVEVHHGNFNQLQIEDAAYDLVLFVGVTEYAGRFSSHRDDHRALQELLALAKRALKRDGVALIAIENRLGAKYLLGACEDHYGQPWVGVQGYPESSGIRTYSFDEWQQQITKSPFEQSHFCYPFPDYKVPSTVINQSHARHLSATESLATMRSRDYLRAFQASADESRLWQGIVQAGCLNQLANSFLILLGDNADRLAQMADFDVVDYPMTNYDWHRAKNPSQKPPRLLALNAQLAELQEKHEQLQAQLALIKGSRRWRWTSWLSRLRRAQS